MGSSPLHTDWLSGPGWFTITVMKMLHSSLEKNGSLVSLHVYGGLSPHARVRHFCGHQRRECAGGWAIVPPQFPFLCTCHSNPLAPAWAPSCRLRQKLEDDGAS